MRHLSSRSAGAPASLELRYGINPHLSPAYATPVDPGRWPVHVRTGQPSYINLLDALAGWQLVREVRAVLHRPAAASFKHVSPAGAAVDGPVHASTADRFRVGGSTLSPVGRAYLRSRDVDPQASYGDLVAVSEPVDLGFARVLRRLACDGIVAPAYEPGSLEILAAKKRGRFLAMEADPDFEPPVTEVRDVFGLRLVQPYDSTRLDRTLVATSVDGTALPPHAVDDLLLGQVILKHTLSNAVAYVRGGTAIGIAAGQQSRIASTRLAGVRADAWWTRRSVGGGEEPHVDQSDTAVVSDGMFPFRDNIDEAARHGVAWIAEPGGSIRSDEVAQACREHGITLVHTGLRLFQH